MDRDGERFLPLEFRMDAAFFQRDVLRLLAARSCSGAQRRTLYITESSQNIIYRVAMKVRGLKLFGDKE